MASRLPLACSRADRHGGLSLRDFGYLAIKPLNGGSRKSIDSKNSRLYLTLLGHSTKI